MKTSVFSTLTATVIHIRHSDRGFLTTPTFLRHPHYNKSHFFKFSTSPLFPLYVDLLLWLNVPSHYSKCFIWLNNIMELSLLSWDTLVLVAPYHVFYLYTYTCQGLTKMACLLLLLLFLIIDTLKITRFAENNRPTHAYKYMLTSTIIYTQ